MRFADLFSGLGGFHLAAAQLGGRCVFASEIDKQLQDIYEANFNMRPNGDIRNVDVKSIPEHDLLCAGFPCQPFSKAGDQMGWEDAIRGTVFYNILEILSYRKPEFIILENVAHFVNHDEGNTYQKVKSALESLGYDVQHAQLSPHQFGVPQIRDRMYMIGCRSGLKGFTWPDPETNASELSIHSILEKNPSEAVKFGDQVMRCLETWQEFLQTFPADQKLPSFPIWSMEYKATYPYDVDSLYKVPLKRLRAYRGSFGQSLDATNYAALLQRVPSHAARKDNAFPHWKQLFIDQNRSLYQEQKGWIKGFIPKIKQFPPRLQKCEWNCQGEERDIWKYIIQFRASGVRIKRPTTAPSLVAMTTTQVPIIAWEKRYMTVRECARLQSMDELKHLPKGNKAMEALGNAVNVKVVQKVLHRLLS